MTRRVLCVTVTSVAALVAVSSGASAASLPGSPLAKLAARAGVSVPAALSDPVTARLGGAPLAPAGTASGQQELQATGGMPLDLFGWTVALTADGHTALVGAPGRIVGAAYVFVERNGKWVQQQEIDSPAGSAADGYGYSVSLSADGSTALVSAYTGNGGNGIVYSYTRRAGGYVLDSQITAPDGGPGDAFGISVSLSALGNVALIGAPDHNGDTGAAYVFAHTPGSWTQQREFQDPTPLEAYGFSVAEAADGLTGVVGAPLASGGVGAAYVVSQPSGSQQQLVATATPATSLFGLSVAINAIAGRVLVGSPSAGLGEGAAFVFARSAHGWSQTQELTPSNPGGADAFGLSVALDYVGDVALIGAPGRNGTAGSAFTFAGDGALAQQRELTEPTPTPSDEYGYSVAVSAFGSELLIGAPYSNNAQGSAWAAAN